MTREEERKRNGQRLARLIDTAIASSMYSAPETKVLEQKLFIGFVAECDLAAEEHDKLTAEWLEHMGCPPFIVHAFRAKRHIAWRQTQ